LKIDGKEVNLNPEEIENTIREKIKDE